MTAASAAAAVCASVMRSVVIVLIHGSRSVKLSDLVCMSFVMLVVIGFDDHG
jgi:hypothetical protein